MFKKFLFIFFLFIFIFVFTCSSAYADGVLGLTWDVPESPDYPNHTYIFIYSHETGNQSTSGIYMIKYYMPVTLLDLSGTETYALRISYVNGLRYKYNPESDTFEIFGTPYPHNDNITASYKNSDGDYVHWDDPTAVTGIFPLASNHNIYIDDGTLFFWTPQQNTTSPLLYRLEITEMMKTLLVVGGRTLGVALLIFGIVLGVSLVKNWTFSFLR